MEFHSICRTCLNQLQYSGYDIFETEDLKKKLIKCISQEVKLNDGYPTNICTSCFTKVNEFFEFQKMSIYALQRLQSMSIRYGVTKQSSPSLMENKCDEKMNYETRSVPEGCDEDNRGVENDRSDPLNEPPVCHVDEMQEATPSVRQSFVCDVCGQRFQKKFKLTAHKRIHEGLKPFPCEQCSKSFTKLNRLKIHSEIVHDGKAIHHICPEEGCQRSYSLQETLRKHIRNAHSDDSTRPKRKTFVCEDCGKVLSSLTILNNHRYMHTNQMLPFECPQCKKRYMTKHKLKVHLNRHEGIKNYICPHCGLKKTTRTELNAHINHHTKEKIYPCKCCGQIFNSAGNLGRHVRNIHEGIKNFKCQYCEKLFSKAETRKHHEMIHTGEKPHECQTCPKRFIQYTALRRHMQMHDRKCNSRLNKLSITEL